MYKLASLLGGALKLKTGVVVSRGKRARKIPRAPWKSGFTTVERPPILPQEFTIPTRSLGNVFPDSQTRYSGFIDTESKHNPPPYDYCYPLSCSYRWPCHFTIYKLRFALTYCFFASNFRSSVIADNHSALPQRIPSSIASRTVSI